MKHIFILLMVFTGLAFGHAKSLVIDERPLAQQKVDYSTWDKLLKKYVDEDGNVDYKNFRKEIGLLNTYLEQQTKILSRNMKRRRVNWCTTSICTMPLP